MYVCICLLFVLYLYYHSRKEMSFHSSALRWTLNLTHVMFLKIKIHLSKQILISTQKIQNSICGNAHKVKSVRGKVFAVENCEMRFPTLLYCKKVDFQFSTCDTLPLTARFHMQFISILIKAHFFWTEIVYAALWHVNLFLFLRMYYSHWPFSDCRTNIEF